MTDDKQRGVRAVNQDFIRYDQVERPRTYHLAEGSGGEAFDEDFQLDTCDIAPLLHGDEASRERAGAELFDAMRRTGFVILTGHGVDPRLYEEAEERTLEFFERTTLEQRMRYRAQRLGSVNQGYFPIKETSDIHPDLVEGWVFCRRAFDFDRDPAFRADQFWPLAEAEPFYRRMCLEHERLILPIMQAVLRNFGCDPTLYDKRLTKTNFGLRLNYYPPVSDADERSGAGRLLGHEDVDLFTFLPAPSVEGLQLLTMDSRWVRVEAPPGSIILNTGDYLQRITNDVLPSTTHRVSKPRSEEACARPRVSFPMAVYLWEDELLEVLPGIANPKYEPVRAITFHTRTTSKFYGDDYAVEDKSTDR